MTAKPAKIGPAKVGIVGLGRCAKLLARAAAKSDKLRIIAAYSRSDQKRRSFQLETRVPVVSDLKTLLSYPMLDGVILTVPDDQHLAVATEVARVKKHVFIESPIANSLEQGLEIAGLEHKYGITVTVGFSARFLAGIRKIREAIDAGEFGAVTLLEANFSSPQGLELTSKDWRGHHDKALAGALSRLAMQQFDVLQYLGGGITEVSAMAAKLSPSPADVDDQSTALLKFPDGKLGYVGSSWTSPGVFALRVFGTKALMHYEVDLEARAGGNLPGNSVLYMQRGKDGFAKRVKLDLPEADAHRAALEIFAESCRTGNSGELSAANGNSSLAVVTAALLSLANKGQSMRVADMLSRAQSRTQELARA